MSNNTLSLLTTFKGKLYSIEFPPYSQTIAQPSQNLDYFSLTPEQYPLYDNFEKIKNHIHPIDYTLKKYQIWRFEKNNTFLLGENWYSPLPNYPMIHGDIDSRFWLEFLEHILPHYDFDGISKLRDNLKDFDINFVDNYLRNKFVLVYDEKDYISLTDEINKYKLIEKLVK